MFAKFVALILSVGIVGGALLTMRQLRIQAAHELGDVQRRVGERDRELWQLRIQIARETRPAIVEAKLALLAQGLGSPIEPIGVSKLHELWPIEQAAADGADPGRTFSRLPLASR